MKRVLRFAFFVRGQLESRDGALETAEPGKTLLPAQKTRHEDPGKQFLKMAAGVRRFFSAQKKKNEKNRGAAFNLGSKAGPFPSPMPTALLWSKRFR